MDRTTIRRICWDGSMIEPERSIERDDFRRKFIERSLRARVSLSPGAGLRAQRLARFIWPEAPTPNQDGDHENVNVSEIESRSWRIRAAPADTLQTQVCCLFSSTAFRLPGSSTAPQWPAMSRADQ